MRVILDTNVLVSGIFFKGIPYKILQGIKQGKYRVIVTKEIVDEYKRTTDKLSRSFSNVVNANDQLDLIVFSSEICQPKRLAEPVCEDPDDDKFVACALASGAKVIVSGDKHLLDISGYRGVAVLKPRAFLEKYFF